MSFWLDNTNYPASEPAAFALASLLAAVRIVSSSSLLHWLALWRRGKGKAQQGAAIPQSKWLDGYFLAAELCARGRLSMKIRNQLFMSEVVLSRLALNPLCRNSCTPGFANNETQNDRQACQKQ